HGLPNPVYELPLLQVVAGRPGGGIPGRAVPAIQAGCWSEQQAGWHVGWRDAGGLHGHQQLIAGHAAHSTARTGTDPVAPFAIGLATEGDTLAAAVVHAGPTARTLALLQSVAAGDTRQARPAHRVGAGGARVGG